jgi:PPP family 3-phenylpropionic acid transporter
MDGVPPRRATARHRDAGLRGAYALLGLVVSSFVPFLTLLLQERGLSPDDIGIVLAVLSLSGVVAAPFWSHAADTRLGTVHTLQLSCAAASVFALGLIVTGSALVAVSAVCALLGAAQAPYTALTDALVLSRLGASRVQEYGSFRLWQSVGWGVGCIVIGAVLTAAGVGLMLPIYAAGAAAYAVYVARFGRSRRPRRGSGRSARRSERSNGSRCSCWARWSSRPRRTQRATSCRCASCRRVATRCSSASRPA